MMKFLHYLMATLLIGAAFLFIARPAFHGGLFQTDDDVQVTRIMAMTEELRGGQFPVRYLDAFGNGGGYFLYNFYSPFAYYLGATLVLIGFSYLQSVKLVFLIVLAAGTGGMFLLLKSKSSWPAAILGTVLFLFSPYLFHDLFHRGALAESSAFLFSPLVFWAFFKLKHSPNKWFFLASVLSFALVVTSHILTGALVGAILLTWLIFSHPKKINLWVYLAAIAVGLTLAGFYFFPAILESRYIKYDQTEYMQHGYQSQFVELPQQLGNANAIAHQQSFLGVGLIIILGMIIWSLAKQRVKNADHQQIFKLITAVSLSGLFLMMKLSSVIWANAAWLRYFQFPYRLLTMLVVFLVLGFSLIFDQLYHRWSKLTLVLAVLVLPTIFYFPYYSALSYQYVPEYRVEGKCKTTAWEDEHFPKTVQECMPGDYNQPLVKSLSDNLIVTDVQTNQHNRFISFSARGSAGKIQITKYYFPGWQVIDSHGQPLKIEPTDKYGLISFDLPATNENQKITVQLGSTWLRNLGNWLSLMTILGLIWLMFLPLPLPVRLPKLKLKFLPPVRIFARKVKSIFPAH